MSLFLICFLWTNTSRRTRKSIYWKQKHWVFPLIFTVLWNPSCGYLYSVQHADKISIQLTALSFSLYSTFTQQKSKELTKMSWYSTFLRFPNMHDQMKKLTNTHPLLLFFFAPCLFYHLFSDQRQSMNHFNSMWMDY